MKHNGGEIREIRVSGEACPLSGGSPHRRDPNAELGTAPAVVDMSAEKSKHWLRYFPVEKIDMERSLSSLWQLSEPLLQNANSICDVRCSPESMLLLAKRRQALLRLYCPRRTLGVPRMDIRPTHTPRGLNPPSSPF